MSYKIWGNTIWYLFHGMAEKLRPEYDEFSIEIANMINKICIILPCEDCSNHAKITIKKCNLKSINTREKLKDFVWKFLHVHTTSFLLFTEVTIFFKILPASIMFNSWSSIISLQCCKGTVAFSKN